MGRGPSSPHTSNSREAHGLKAGLREAWMGSRPVPHMLLGHVVKEWCTHPGSSLLPCSGTNGIYINLAQSTFPQRFLEEERDTERAGVPLHLLLEDRAQFSPSCFPLGHSPDSLPAGMSRCGAELAEKSLIFLFCW